MKPRPVTMADADYWRELSPVLRTFTTPKEIDAGVEPCEALVTDDQIGNQFGKVARVPWMLDEIELAQLARGGTLWLSTWGGLPMHVLEVQEPA